MPAFWDRVFKVMDEHGLDALVASTSENVSYLGDIPRIPGVVSDPDAQVVAFREKGRDPAVIIGGVALDQYAQSTSDIKDVRIYNPFYYYKSEELDYSRLSEAERKIARIYFGQSPAKGVVQALANLFRERGLVKGTVGFDEKNVPPERMDGLQKELPRITLQPANKTFEEIRMVKSSEEMDRIRNATSATEKGIQAVMEAAKPGIVNRELQHVFRATLMKHDCTPYFAVIGAGTEGALVNHLPSNYVLKKGDTMRIDCNSLYRNYVSDVGRNAVLGPPSQKAEKYCRALIKGVEAMEKIVRPGLKVSNLFKEAVSTVQTSGMPHYQRQNVGHSIGLQVMEPPVLTPENDTELQENMIIAIEMPYYEIGFGAFNPEDMIRVTKNGSERLTRMENRFYIL